MLGAFLYVFENRIKKIVIGQYARDFAELTELRFFGSANYSPIAILNPSSFFPC